MIKFPFFKSILALLIFTFQFSCNGGKGNAPNGFIAVTKIVDGDTFWADDGSGSGLKIRLIGVDAPETRKSAHKDIGYYGEEAKAYLRKLLEGKNVRLEYDVRRFDKYQRTLAYVYLEDGTFVNAELIKNGYASVLTIPPDVKYADLFVKLQSEARNGYRGLWNNGH